MPPHTPSPSLPLSQPQPQDNITAANLMKPHVLIVGGGIGGLTLAILLEQARIPYTVLERSAYVRLLGSAIALGPGVLPLFEQLGLLSEIEQHSRPVTRGMVWSEKLVPIMDLDHTSTQKRYGFLTRVISRPTLYQILLSHVPKEKIIMGKKVVSFTQTKQRQEQYQAQPSSLIAETGPHPVVITCTDGTQFSGDILVGADGAYSITRHLMYQQMEDDYISASAIKYGSGSRVPTTQSTSITADHIPTPFSSGSPLPASDKELLSFTSTCLVGQTRPGLDLSKFKYVRGPDCKVGSIIGDNKPYSWSVFSMPDDSICWMVTEHLKESFLATQSASVTVPAATTNSSACSAPLSTHSSRSASPAPSSSSFSSGPSKSDETSSEWGPLRVDVMCEQVKDFPIPCGPGLKISDLIQHTDRDRVSKVMLEEKLFETWSYGRVVLLGDACHKMHPSAGLGAVAAIQDAAVLSDLLFQLPASPTLEDLAQAFRLYREDRYHIAQQSYETSYQMSHLNEQSWISNFIRRVMNNLPKWIWYRVLDRMYEYRPQVSFLPRVEDHGDVPPLPLSYATCTNGFNIEID